MNEDSNRLCTVYFPSKWLYVFIFNFLDKRYKPYSWFNIENSNAVDIIGG